jgi:hypothetical protein
MAAALSGWTRTPTDFAARFGNQSTQCDAWAPRRPGLSKSQEACFVVRDHNGQALAYVYFEDEPGRRSAAKLLSNELICINERKFGTRLSF